MTPSPPIRTTRPAMLDTDNDLILQKRPPQTDDFRRLHQQILQHERDAMDPYGIIPRGAP